MRSATRAGWLIAGTVCTIPCPSRIRLVRCDAAARNSSGALECEYSSRKWCSTSQAQSKPSRSASSICSSASAKTRCSSPSCPRPRHLVLEEQPELHRELRRGRGTTLMRQTVEPTEVRSREERGGAWHPAQRRRGVGRRSSCAHTGVLTTLRARRRADLAPGVVRRARPADLRQRTGAHEEVRRASRNDPRVSFLVESGERWADLLGVHSRERPGSSTTPTLLERVAAALADKYGRFRTPRDRDARRDARQLRDGRDDDRDHSRRPHPVVGERAPVRRGSGVTRAART